MARLSGHRAWAGGHRDLWIATGEEVDALHRWAGRAEVMAAASTNTRHCANAV
jgi:hypothetical protein